MKEKKYAPGQTILNKGEQLNYLYFVTQGDIEYFCYENKKSLIECNNKDIDIRLFLSQKPSEISIRSKTVVTVSYISYFDFLEVIKQHKKDYVIIIQKKKKSNINI